MDKSTKTILIVIASLLVLCACGAAVVFATGLWSFGKFVNFAEQSVSESPVEAIRVGGEIADYVVPAGFGSPYSLHYDDVTVVTYRTQDERSHLLLAQFPEGTGINTEEMLREIRKGSGDPNSIWYNTDMTLIEQKSVTIRGQETTLNVSEGTSSQGVAYRMAAATFQGRGGPALAMVAGVVDEWDMKVVEDFVRSIH